jgi:hypothetical protein
MYQEDFNDENPEINDFSIETLKRSLDESNNSLLESLKQRYMQELIGSMVFFIFNQMCQNAKIESGFTDKENGNLAQIFFSSWLKASKKEAKKEILEINKKLKDNNMNFLGAISNYSLPSTEDYQSIYNKAILEIQKIFQKNTEM